MASRSRTSSLQHALEQVVDRLEQHLGEQKVVVAGLPQLRAGVGGDLAHALGVAGGLAGQHGTQAAEGCQHRLGDGLGVAAIDREEQQQFEQLVVRDGRGTTLQEALAQPLAMAVIVLAAPALEAAGTVLGETARGADRFGEAVRRAGRIER